MERTSEIMTSRNDPNARVDGFDQYAESYDAALNQGLSVTGESKDYFAQKRVSWLKSRLTETQTRPGHILDYGCGTGSTTVLLRTLFKAESVTGVDTSSKSLDQAKKLAPECQFLLNAEYQGADEMDMVYCNGVFHHIPPAQRVEELLYIRRALRPGGLFALWENNPWNPGARYVMSRIPFDRDAIVLSPIETRRLVRESGFEILRVDFLFFFPGFLSFLRVVEPLMSNLPLGGQYLVLCRRPEFS